MQVALLRDAGLPALTDQELLEHDIARLYFGAFGQVADSAGLVLQTVSFQTALSGLVTIGDGLVASAEFTARYGKLSDSDFVRTVFQNVFGRAATADDVASGVASLNRPRFGFSRGGLGRVRFSGISRACHKIALTSTKLSTPSTPFAAS